MPGEPNTNQRTEGKRAFSEALAHFGIDMAAASAPVKRDLRCAGEALLARAQAAGAVRDDIGGEELMAVLVGLSRVAEYAGDQPEVRAKAVRALVDGLRPRSH